MAAKTGFLDKVPGGGILRAMSVTLRHLFRPDINVQYPDEKLLVPQRIRGLEFHWFEDRCTGCGICAKACPNGVIRVQARPDPANPLGKRLVERYDMDLGICLFCGLCAEACPFLAIYMGDRPELVSYTRVDMLYDKERLTAVLAQSKRHHEGPVELGEGVQPVQLLTQDKQ